ncbi:MAG TPA: hypothetical protein VKO63_07705, partial [Chitinispirillaceae bacterium]|nr:hypothetical protein [Chitinispirillaceae bacterium]
MNHIIKTMLVCVTLSITAFSQIGWQTTRDGASTGNCHLISSKISVTINSYYADIVEEAEIETDGSVFRGDPKSLEILGFFYLSSTSALRSMLLWNNDTILKAKLLERADADSAYEQVVDRTQQKVVIRDPAIIHYLGGNRYSYRIYPVEINHSRKIRILYSVPVQFINGVTAINIKPAFALSASPYPQSLPVEITNISTSISHCIIQHSYVKRTVSFGSTYTIPIEELVNGVDINGIQYEGLLITPIFKTTENMYLSKIDSGSAKGYYYAIQSIKPDTITKLMNSRTYRAKNMILETQLTLDNKTYVNIIDTSTMFSHFIKTVLPWDSTIIWNCYDNDNGARLFSIKQKFTKQSDSLHNQLLPLLWARMNAQSERLGAFYGYVDLRMSLLALESDKLDPSLVALYTQSGVPGLTPSEILTSSSKKPVVTDPNSERQITSVQKRDTKKADFTMRVINNTIAINFSEQLSGTVSAILIDAQGKVVQEFGRLSITGFRAELALKSSLKGTFFVK